MLVERNDGRKNVCSVVDVVNSGALGAGRDAVALGVEKRLARRRGLLPRVTTQTNFELLCKVRRKSAHVALQQRGPRLAEDVEHVEGCNQLLARRGSRGFWQILDLAFQLHTVRVVGGCWRVVEIAQWRFRPRKRTCA